MCCTSQLKFSRSQAQVAKLARWNAKLEVFRRVWTVQADPSVNRKYWHTRTTHKRKLVFLSLWPEGHRHDCYVCLCLDMREWEGRGCCACVGANVSLNLKDAGTREGVRARVRACVGATWGGGEPDVGPSMTSSRAYSDSPRMDKVDNVILLYRIS